MEEGEILFKDVSRLAAESNAARGPDYGKKFLRESGLSEEALTGILRAAVEGAREMLEESDLEIVLAQLTGNALTLGWLIRDQMGRHDREAA